MTSRHTKDAIDEAVNNALELEYRREQQKARHRKPNRMVRIAAALTLLAAVASTALVLSKRREPPATVATATTAPAPTDASAVLTQATPQPTDATATPNDTDILVNDLVSLGLSVVALPNASDNETVGLSAPTRRYCIGGTTVHVLEYSSIQEREKDSTGIAPDGKVTVVDGSEATVTITQWSAPPRFFTQGRLIVLAVGPDDSTIAAFTEILGVTLTPNATGLTQHGSCPGE